MSMKHALGPRRSSTWDSHLDDIEQQPLELEWDRRSSISVDPVTEQSGSLPSSSTTQRDSEPPPSISYSPSIAPPTYSQCPTIQLPLSPTHQFPDVFPLISNAPSPWSKSDQWWYVGLSIYGSIMWIQFFTLGISFVMNRGQDYEPHHDIKGAIWGGVVFGLLPIYFMAQFWCYRYKFRVNRAAFDQHVLRNPGALGALFLLISLWGGFSLVLSISSFPLQNINSSPTPLRVFYNGTTSNCFSEPTNTTLFTLVWINFGIPVNSTLFCRTEENPIGIVLGLFMGLSSIPLAIPILLILLLIIGLVLLIASIFAGDGGGSSGGDCGGGGDCYFYNTSPCPSCDCCGDDCGCCKCPKGCSPGVRYIMTGGGGWCGCWSGKGRRRWDQDLRGVELHELEDQEGRARRKKRKWYERLRTGERMSLV